MFFGVFFLGLGIALGNLALVRPGAFAVVLFWAALACVLASSGWFLGDPWPYGKRPNGTRNPLLTLLLFPFLLTLWSAWYLVRFTKAEALWNNLAPGIVIGRRLLDREWDLEVDAVIDLTAEFSEPRKIRRHPGYRCRPILDGSVPDDHQFAEWVADAAALDGVVYVHCAEGHGRTALFGAALLLAKGLARDAVDAEKKVLAARPLARMNRAQRRALARFALSSRQTSSDPSQPRP